MPRRTWLDSKIDVFLEELAASGMHLDRQRAGELITGQVRAVAALVRVTEATARTYLGDEIIKDMARRMLFQVAVERPGADLMEAPRPFRCRWPWWGSPSRPWPRQCRYGRQTSRSVTWGTSSPPTRRRCPGSGRSPPAPRRSRPAPGRDPVPPALLRRAARYISGAADLAANGGKLPDGIPETARSQLAATLRRDADGLIAITTTD